MTGPKQPSFLARPFVLKLVVLLALLANGLFWAVRFPAWHPNDEPQHYLYASHFDGAEPINGKPDADQVPRDLQAFIELVDFGPHRTIRRTIDLSKSRTEEMQRLRAEADDPALARVYVDDAEVEDVRIIGHPDFENYHPPLYYAALGQVLRIGHAAGLGIRGRLLIGRLFSVLLGLLAAWLAMLLARILWPDEWAMPALVGLATGMQIFTAFYTSVLNNENLAFLLFTAFLAFGAWAIVHRPSWLVVIALVLVGVLAVATKVTMVALFPMGLIALMLCDVPRRVRVGSGVTLAACVAIALLWLLIPLGGGESLQSHYASGATEPRSFPAEMFTPGRIWEHGQMIRRYWGLKIGNAVWTDAWMRYRLHDMWSVLSIVSLLVGLAMLRRLDPPRRKMMLWLLTAPLMLGLLLYAIDYRFASMINSRFVVRGQYYIPATAAQMMWMVWGLAGWLKGRARTVMAGGFIILLVGFNLWALHFVISPRYFGPVGWWEQCRQIAEIWPIPVWGVAMVDLLAAGTAALAFVALVLALRATQRRVVLQSK